MVLELKDQANIKNMTIEEPEQVVPSGPARLIRRGDFPAIKQRLDFYSNLGMIANHFDMACSLAYLGLDKEELFQIHQGEEFVMSKIQTSIEAKRWDYFLIYSLFYKVYFPEKFQQLSLSENDHWEGIKNYIQSKKDNEVDFIGSLEDVIFLYPQKIHELKPLLKWDRVSALIKENQSKDNFGNYLSYLLIAKLYFPEQFKEIGLSKSDIYAKLVNERDTSQWPQFIHHAGLMHLLEADEIKITPEKIDIIMKKQETTQITPFPEVRKF